MPVGRVRLAISWSDIAVGIKTGAFTPQLACMDDILKKNNSAPPACVCVCINTHQAIAMQYYAITRAYQVTEWPIDMDPPLLLTVTKGQSGLDGRSLM